MQDVEWVDQNSLMNISYLTQIANLQISDKNPVEYLQSLEAFIGDRSTAETVADSHLLPHELLDWADNGELPSYSLSEFVDLRTELVLDDLKRKVGVERMHVVDTGASSDEID